MENNSSIITTILLSSKEQNELFSALSKAQADFKIASWDEQNPHFKKKFSSYKALVEATRPALSANGLSVNHKTITDIDGKQYMITKLMHSSGQFDASLVPLRPDKRMDIQGYGSERSYQMRYSYKEIVGVSSHDKEDDDGNAAVSQSQEQESNTGNDFIQHNVVDPAKIESFRRGLSTFANESYLEECVLSHNKIRSLDDMKENQYDGAVNWVKQNGIKK